MKSLFVRATFSVVALLPATLFAIGEIQSARNGPWSAATTWVGGQVPGEGARVLVRAGHRVVYDIQSDAVIRGISVAGTLAFSREHSTRLNVGLLKVQPGNQYSEDGFACDAHFADATVNATMPTLEVGTPSEPIPAGVTAHILLHHVEGMDKESCPAIVACRGRMEFHGAPMNRTWLKLGAPVSPGASEVMLIEAPTGWRVGDRVIVTATSRKGYGKGYQTEERIIRTIAGATLTLDQPLEFEHQGAGEYRGEVANLSRNVVIESAAPGGVRGHTMFHRGSAGGISHAEFRHLGKEGVLGRYSIHFHLAGDTMRGSAVIGASIWDSANRWITIHGTQFLVVRDCVGYRSTGHGFFLEDGTEAYNVLDRNLGVQARQGKKLPNQVLPFDQNEGAAFWWANSLNTFTRNVSVENAHYGYRYEATASRSMPLNLNILQPDGTRRATDIRTLPFIRFEENEAHSEAGLYAFNLGEGVNRVGPDERHPFVVRDFKVWNVHYAFRPQVPSLLVERLHIHDAAYGVYHPNFDRHVYRDVFIGATDTEPFNRGHDDDSKQYGKLSVDGLTFDHIHGGRMPLVQISDDNMSGTAETHFRNVKVSDWRGGERDRALVNRGGGPRPAPTTVTGVPVFLHDWFGAGRTAKIASTAAKDFGADGLTYRSEKDLTGDESRVAEVKNIPWPELLHPVDDLPPATVILSAGKRADGKFLVRGVTQDNGEITEVMVNGQRAKIVTQHAGVADWEITLSAAKELTASAKDKAGNAEHSGHRLALP